jgi:hypothetical protein
MSTSIADYFKLLTDHDWTYQHADEFRAWVKGAEERRRLEYLALGSEQRASLYIAFRDFHAGLKTQLPTCPEEET